LRARGHEGGRVAGAECFFDPGNERAQVEEAMNFHFGQDVHGRILWSILKEEGSSQFSEQAFSFMELFAREAGFVKSI
jgi:hypothetical protein